MSAKQLYLAHRLPQYYKVLKIKIAKNPHV